MKMHMEIFQVADTLGSIAGGWYWQDAEHQLLRGPFPTEEEADADAKRMGTQLLAVILLPDDATEEELRRLQTAETLITNSAEKKRTKARRTSRTQRLRRSK
jgi:hypothetical protein